MKKVLGIYFLLTISLILLDQVIKWWLNLSYPFLIYANSGLLFGWINNQWLVYSIIILGLMILIYIIKSMPRKITNSDYVNLDYLSLALIASGAISNLADRIIYGYVLDYLRIGFWPVFNLADIYIFVGAFLFAYKIFKYK